MTTGFLTLSKATEKEKKAIADELWPNIPKKMNTEEAVDLRYRWYFPERGIKFFINTVRSYEYFGYQWYNPLHDRELQDFWFSLDERDYFKRRLQFEYNNEYMAKYTGITESIPVIAYSVRDRLKRLYMTPALYPIKKTVLKPLLYQYKKYAH